MEEKTITSSLEVFDWNIGYHHFPVDPKTTKQLSSEGHRRIVCTVNNQVVMHCALMPQGEGSFIMVSKKVRSELGIVLGDNVELNLKKETSEYGMPMPESFEMVLIQDEIALAHFKKLTPGKQRSLIYIVKKLKNIDKQITKSLAIAAHLTEMNGQLDFKLLNEKIKEYNNNTNLNIF